MDSLTLCSDIIAEHRDISLDEEISIDSLHTEEYEWLKFIPNETKKYYLLCYGDKDVKIDVLIIKLKVMSITIDYILLLVDIPILVILQLLVATLTLYLQKALHTILELVENIIVQQTIYSL